MRRYMFAELINDIAVGGSVAAAEVLPGVTDAKVVAQTVHSIVLACLEVYIAESAKLGGNVLAEPSLN